jgi:hypothetical protein
MADTVYSIVLRSGPRNYVVRLTNVSDATGEAAVTKVDISTLVNAHGQEVTRTIVKKIQWSIQGFTSVRLFWDHTTDDEIAVLSSGVGMMDWTQYGGLHDPASTGGTGDILLTTAGAAANATYMITLEVELI